MIDLVRLRALRAVATYGTVTAAASALHCTPSAVSQHLAKLDRETGSTLLERDGRRLRLTGAGRVLVAHAGRVLAAVEEAETWVASVPGSVCHEWLLRALPGVRPRYLVAEFATQLALVATGLGVALIPRLARPSPPSGVAVVPVDPPPTRRVTLAWRSAATVRPAIGAAIDALRAAWSSAPTAEGGQ